MKIYNVKPLTLAILSGFLVFTTPSWSIISQDGTEINATIKDGKFIFTGVTSGKGKCFFYPTPSQVEWTTDNALCQGVSTRPGQTPYDQGYPYIIIRALPSEWTLSGGIYPPTIMGNGLGWLFYTSTSQIYIPLTYKSEGLNGEWVYDGIFSVPGGSYNISTTEPDGHYTASINLSFGTNPILGRNSNLAPGGGGTVNLEYEVRNGGVVPPYTPVTCNFSRVYTDSSGTSSGTNILHSYGDMKPGATGSKKTMLVYSCDRSASSFTASLRNAAISVKKTTAGASEVATKTVINDGTGKLDVSLTGIKGPLPVYNVSDNEFIIGFMSTLTTKSAGSIKYTDILVLSYD
ncbi:TPA: hypothetical protein ACXZW1_004337 [Salmonella enterica]